MSSSITHKDTNKTIDLSTITTFKIGRLGENNLTLPNVWVSRRHAMIQRESTNSYYVIDLGSANGTFVNGIRLTTPTKLASGDVISFGKSHFNFHTTENPPPPPNQINQTIGEETVACIDKKKATLLVCDIHRYTELSELIGNEQLSNMLQTWTRLTSEIILQFKGQIDKFIGDAVLAFWIQEKHEHLAGVLSAALLIQQMTSRLGLKRSLPFPLTIGAAINTGEVMLGNIGSSGQRDYTMIGDTVNTTFRLESKTSKTNELILGGETYNNLKIAKQLFAPQTFDLKGKKDKIEAYATTFRQLEYELNKNNTIHLI
jgi:class 3 adenylate cyclase